MIGMKDHLELNKITTMIANVLPGRLKRLGLVLNTSKVDLAEHYANRYHSWLQDLAQVLANELEEAGDLEQEEVEVYKSTISLLLYRLYVSEAALVETAQVCRKMSEDLN